MIMMRIHIKFLVILALGLSACEPEFDNPIDTADAYSSGDADFSNYVSIGNSLTAGYADGALYISGQENSYPNMLSKQFAYAGGGDFAQPLMDDNVGGFVNDPVNFPPRFVLVFDAEGSPVGPARYTGAAPSTDFSNNLGKSYNNMGVPGAKSYHLLAPGYGNAAGVASGLSNPYFARFASSTTATVIGDAVGQNPTFFSLWIGNNDILSYATSGGVGEDHNKTGELDPANYGSNDITNSVTFSGVYKTLLDNLTAGGAKGVVLNLPSVTSLPFFTTVPYAPLSPLNPDFAAQIPELNQTYAGLNLAFEALGVPERAIQFSTTGASPVVIKDESLTDITASLTVALSGTFGPLAPVIAAQYGQARQATQQDLLLLTSSSQIGEVDTARVAELMGVGMTQEQAGKLSVKGVSLPLADQYVLIPAEQKAIENARKSYNATIASLASLKGLAMYDVAAALEQAANGGIPINGGVVTSTFVSGGAFSLDGVHPTPRAHALVTNGVLDAIEAVYGANLPKVDPADYGTITLSNDVN